MPKAYSIFMCSSCGNEFPKWSGQCPACQQWNSLTEVSSFLKPSKSSKKTSTPSAKPVSIKEALSIRQSTSFKTTINELDRVLGPGLTYGGVYLLAGQPGIGKSTLLTQLAIKLAQTTTKSTPRSSTILYACSEENPAQVATRLNRLSNRSTLSLQLLGSSNVEQILQSVQSLNPKLVIIDSIQSVQTDANPTMAGSPSQIRDSATLLIQSAKENSLPMILVGHVTKQGTIAGPKLLEHMVDAVLELSGDKQHDLRMLHAHKNRFGPTDETGIFKMTGAGLEEVPDPSVLLLSSKLENTPGSALSLVMEGTRPLTVEVQALVVPSSLAIPRRVAMGITTNRLQLICAILSKHYHLNLSDKDVYLNITGGLSVREPGADLGIALSIISSTKNISLPNKAIAFGELGLLGEIRSVTFQDKRQKEAKALGYKHIFSPVSNKHLRSLKL